MTIRYRKVLFGIAAALTVGTVPAQDIRIVKFKGLINDYTPSTVAGGPYEIPGDWSVDVQRNGTANFAADLNMETSDYGITSPAETMPRMLDPFRFLLFAIAGWMNQRQQHAIEYLRDAVRDIVRVRHRPGGRSKNWSSVWRRRTIAGGMYGPGRLADIAAEQAVTLSP